MAKKAVATFKKGDGRTYSKVIKMVKSPKTGAYIFQEEMIPNEAVKDYFGFLAGGCSTDPVSLLKIAGADLSSEKPFRAAMEEFKNALEEFEALS